MISRYDRTLRPTTLETAFPGSQGTIAPLALRRAYGTLVPVPRMRRTGRTSHLTSGLHMADCQRRSIVHLQSFPPTADEIENLNLP